MKDIAQSYLNPLIGGSLAIGLLNKLNPRMKDFIQYGIAAGYGTNEILDFLRNKIEGPTSVAEENRLEQGMAEGTLRPDEKAAYTERKVRNRPLDIAQAVAPLAGGITAGLLSRGLGDAQQTEAIPGNIGNGKNEGIGEAQSMSIPNPLSKEGISEDLKKIESTQPASQAFEENFSHLFDRVREGLENGISPEDIYETLKKRPLYRPLVASFEKKEGRTFLERIYEIAGMQRRNQGSGQKEQFLSGLNQLSQMLQGMKR